MIVALDEIPRATEPCDPSLDWRPVRDHLGIGAFGVNAFLGAQPGERVVERHTSAIADATSPRSSTSTSPPNPNHARWTLALHFYRSHDEIGESILVARTHHVKVNLIPFPRKYVVWQVVERWEELAPRMRALVSAVRRADPDAEIEVDREMRD